MRRSTAWLLMLVCAWMGTGGVLHHTEAELGVKPLPKAASGLHRPTAAAPVDTCAACQWTQGLQSRTVSIGRVQFPLVYVPPRLQSPVSLFIVRPLYHRPSRAPPVTSAFC